ncbi:uncharacterized protein LOC113511222, partial [Galleria mellonella]|uniref:Uncharacterized protein LOC113511222 n=1 Tax=Galleria mellonella TaxID=7137 RepID=A0ABM3MY42_GALME
HVQILRQKDQALPDIIVEGLAESLLDLATSDHPDILQRQEILASLNLCCAESSRDIRFALRHHLDCYFIKLSALLATCGHHPTQYSMLETLLRWLLPRQNMSVKQSAAAKWFPEHTYQRSTVDLFLKRPWQNFFQDARDFLNCHNASRDLVTSVICRKLTVGDLMIVSRNNKRDSWLDLNTASKSISILMDVRMMEVLGRPEQPACETLLISKDKVESVILYRDTTDVTISIRMLTCPSVHPSSVDIEGRDVKIVVSSNSDLNRLNTALQRVFAEKYRVSLDLTAMQPASPQPQLDTSAEIASGLEEVTRLSHPVRVTRRKQSGVIVRPRAPVSLKSPSTVSTTSLLQLREKLSNLPTYRYEKETAKVCAFPELSSVSELTEVDDRESIFSNITYKRRHCGQNNFRNFEKNSQSDGEKYNSRKCLSPVTDEEHSNSCLLVATVGSDEGIINDTVERLSKSKDYKNDNIVDLLVQEALQTIETVVQDSGLYSNDNRKTQDVQKQTNAEAMEKNSELAKNVSVLQTNNDTKVVIQSHTDDSNEIQETPLNYVNIRRKKTMNDDHNRKEHVEDVVNKNKMPVFDEEIVEKFFAQHIEDRGGNIVVSPTLARKINETSSEGSNEQLETFLTFHDDYMNAGTVYDMEIIECLNNIVDKVCSDLDKCEELLNRDISGADVIRTKNLKSDSEENIPLGDLSNIEKKTRATPKKKGSKTKTSIKLTFNTKKDKLTKTRAKKQKDRLDIKSIKKMSPIPEINLTTEAEVAKKVTNNANTDIGTVLSPVRTSEFDLPLIHRKRKLYSPKEGEIELRKQISEIEPPLIHASESKDSKNINIKTKGYDFLSTCYKEIEKERNKNVRQTCLRKTRSKKIRTPSPKTQKMNELFDKLKKDVNNQDVILADKKTIDKDLAIYNFTSDSEDENFMKKKIDIKKRVSSTTIGSDSTVSRYGRLKNVVNSNKNTSSDVIVKPKKQGKKVVRRKKTKSRKAYNLVDERMREAPAEVLNTSFVVEKPVIVNKEPELLLEVAPEMEVITENENKSNKILPQRKAKKTTKLDMSLKKKKSAIKPNMEVITSDDRTTSPLPGLVVETVTYDKGDADDSVSTQMIAKFKKIYQEGPECPYETNTTQNLLDAENVNYSSQHLNITDDLNEIDYTDMISNTKKMKVIIEPINTNSENKNKSKENTEIAEQSNQIVQVEIHKEITNSKVKDKKTINSSIQLIGGEIDKDSNTQKLKPKSRKSKTSEYIQYIEIMSNTDAKSEKSIATVGNYPITGHGDSDEAPPDSGELAQKVDSRNLELEDLDQSMKDYYLKLRNEIFKPLNIGSRRSSKSKGAQNLDLIDNDDKSETIKSPVVSLKRLQYDDISKWLPSRRNSSETSISTYKVPSPVKKMPPIKPIVSQFMPSNNTSFSSGTDKQIEINMDINPKQMINIRNTDNFKEKPTKINLNESLSPMESNKATTQTNRRSVISPIKLFDEWALKNDKSIPKLNEKTKIVSVDVHNVLSSPEIQVCDKSRSDSSIESRRHTLSKVTRRVNKPHSIITSVDSKISSPTRVETRSGLKRKPGSSVSDISKKRRMDTAELSQSTTVSSVDDWLRKNALSTAGSITLSCRDSIQNVMEKLDTTLQEIHQNTSKKFVHMFVDAQKQLCEQKAERRELYKQVSSDIVAEVVRIMDAKIADLEKRSQEMDNIFINQLKQRATDLIREDCKQKQTMVVLLREDLQALMNQMKK